LRIEHSKVRITKRIPIRRIVRDSREQKQHRGILVRGVGLAELGSDVIGAKDGQEGWQLIEEVDDGLVVGWVGWRPHDGSAVEGVDVDGEGVVLAGSLAETQKRE
jgi:hypothetical protein